MPTSVGCQSVTLEAIRVACSILRSKSRPMPGISPQATCQAGLPTNSASLEQRGVWLATRRLRMGAGLPVITFSCGDAGNAVRNGTRD